jgi:hypothetical protein
MNEHQLVKLLLLHLPFHSEKAQSMKASEIVSWIKIMFNSEMVDKTIAEIRSGDVE